MSDLDDLGGPVPGRDGPTKGIRLMPGMILTTVDGGRVVVDYYCPLTGDLRVIPYDTSNDNLPSQE